MNLNRVHFEGFVIVFTVGVLAGSVGNPNRQECGVGLKQLVLIRAGHLNTVDELHHHGPVVHQQTVKP